MRNEHHEALRRARTPGIRVVAGLSVGLALLVSGCSPDPAPTTRGEPLEADVRFMQDMIVHHAQAIVMVSLVRDRLADTQVKSLAARIADEQRPEIDAMAKWLEDRDQTVPPQAANPEAGAAS